MVLVDQSNGVKFPSGKVQPPDWCIASVEPANKPNEYIFKVFQPGTTNIRIFRMTGVDVEGRPVMVEQP